MRWAIPLLFLATGCGVDTYVECGARDLDQCGGDCVFDDPAEVCRDACSETEPCPAGFACESVSQNDCADERDPIACEHHIAPADACVPLE